MTETAGPESGANDPAKAVADHFRQVVNYISQVDTNDPGAANMYCIAIRITGRPNPFDTYGHEISADQFRAFVAEHDGLLAELERRRAENLAFAERALLAAIDRRDRGKTPPRAANVLIAAYRRLAELEYDGTTHVGVQEMLALLNPDECEADDTPTLDPGDLRVDEFTNYVETHVRITHLPTGLVGVGHDPDSPRSGLAAKAVAMRALKEALANARRVGDSNANT